jgi:hypothetical protein
MQLQFYIGGWLTFTKMNKPVPHKDEYVCHGGTRYKVYEVEHNYDTDEIKIILVRI